MLELIAVIAIVGYVIGRQLLGEPLRGRRLILLPAVLTVIGLVDLTGKGHPASGLSILMIAIGAVIAAAIGTFQGRAMRLRSKDGHLFGQMPVWSLALWGALILSRVTLMLVSHGIGAELAAGTTPILFTLGVNRLAQALVIAPRAWMAGIPFAPEKDGRIFLAQIFDN